MHPAVASPEPTAVHRYHRAPSPIHFPTEASVPESKRHLDLRTLLYTLLKTMAAEHSIGSEQFVYWNASSPARCLAPDAFVRRGTPDTSFTSWKTWERGAPELAVEIVSDSDAPQVAWSEKLARYGELGIKELVRFDPDAEEGQRIRIWDRVEGDLVERQIEGDRARCNVLGLTWVVMPSSGYPVVLRLARDPHGDDLMLTP
jgi:Uma2 family endonuclease